MESDMLISSLDEKKAISQHFLSADGEFAAYFDLFNDLTQRDNDSHVAVNISQRSPITAQALVRASDLVRANSASTKRVVLQLYAGVDPTHDEKVVGLAVQAMYMIDPDAGHWHSPDFTLGDYRPSSWCLDETIAVFIEGLFPTSLAASQGVARLAVQQRAIRACKLQRRLGLTFRRTNNLAEHLLFDTRRNCLYIFHHVEFLKAQLRRYRHEEKPLQMGFPESLKGGTVPPQLLVETLYSIQGLLFPSIDPASAEILDELIDKRKFDAGCSEYEGFGLFPELPPDFQFLYWGERMALLHRRMTHRPPRNKLERLFHQYSTEGNALFVALLALLMSIIVGIVSIALNCVQIWITWMAWKKPVA